MGSKSKQQMTQAKRAREQTLMERRLRKQEKKQARRAEAAAVVPEGDGGEAGPSTTS